MKRLFIRQNSIIIRYPVRVLKKPVNSFRNSENIYDLLGGSKIEYFLTFATVIDSKMR
jgi:hypothetical protein